MRKFLATAAVFALAAGAANAQAFTAVYDFTGNGGNETSESITANPTGLTFTPIVRGSGITAATGGPGLSSNGFTTSTTVDLNDYYGFTVTPDAGYGLDLNQMAFSHRRSNTGVRAIAVRTSLDNYTTDVFTTTVLDTDLTYRETVTFGAAYDNITSGLTIRIYGYNAEASGGTWRLGVSTGDNPNGFAPNVEVSGVAVAPEPGTFALLGLALPVAGAVIARRRKTSK